MNGTSDAAYKILPRKYKNEKKCISFIVLKMNAKDANQKANEQYDKIKHERLSAKMDENLKQCRINIATAVQNGEFTTSCYLGDERYDECYECDILRAEGFTVERIFRCRDARPIVGWKK